MKRIDADAAPRLVVLFGKWIILAYEHGFVWINNRLYDSRKEAEQFSGVTCLANSYGWTKLGPSPKLIAN